MNSNIKETIKKLVIRFSENEKVYKNPNYNETQLRREFLDPFFSALGWDVANKQGFAEQYKEVVHEDSVKISGTTKAPDYSFRIGGVRKFFVEAKKPAIDIKYDIHPSYQLRRYAWSAKLPISILTDFEEFSVYDCRIKPTQNDSASVARIYYQTYDNYLKDLEFIYNTFSKEAILKGGFDKYISTATKKKGTSEVDKEFLKEIERWRDALARNIALRNKVLSIFELNFVVQLTIDRIIFLRITEDRGIEDYRNLYKLAEKKEIYKNLFNIFRIADDKYNSGIFDFQKDKISPNINIDDKVLKSILLHLYYPESPYEFSVLPADILGNIYEQFLGKTIRLTPSHQAKVEEKPEVRKAGGVYYTPKYIVDYIVKNTVGERIKGKTPQKISKITICDPACGSGSFLIQAYQYLLNYHLEFYQKDLKKYKNKIIQIGENSYQLTTQEKKRILLNNVYGVDIDPQAVEVTKLSLLLKVLEGENRETLQSQLKLFHERALPNLSNNIKCGNSLIGTDYYDNVDMLLFKNDEMRKINAFDWEKEFPQIFKPQDKKHQHKIPLNKGGKLSETKLGDVIGFDVLIGNPPWVDIKGLDPELVKYYFRKYKTTENRINLYAIFIDKSLKLLNKKGNFSFIIPNSLLMKSSYFKLRKIILEEYHIENIVRLPDNVFQGVKAESMIIVLNRKLDGLTKIIIYDKDQHIKLISNENCKSYFSINTKLWRKNKFTFNIFISPEKSKLLNKIEENFIIRLDKFCDFSLGLTPYDKYRGHTKEQIKNKVFHSDYKKDETYKKLLKGADIKRYYIKWNSNKWIKYGKWLGAPRDERFFKNERIIIRQIVSGDPLRIYASYCEEELYNTQIAFTLLKKDNVNYSLKYFLAIINSKLMNFYHTYRYLDVSKKLFKKVLIENCKQFPIRKIDFSNPSEKQIHDTPVSLVDQMLSTQKQFHSAKIERDKKLYKQKIDILDGKIDKLVYEFYDLTKEEIKIVEEQANNEL